MHWSREPSSSLALSSPSSLGSKAVPAGSASHIWVFERQIGSNKYSIGFFVVEQDQFILFTFVIWDWLILLSSHYKSLDLSATKEERDICVYFLHPEVFAIALLKALIYPVFSPTFSVWVVLEPYPAKNLVTSGPYGLIFASFVPFFFDIPVSTRFRVFRVHFSDKSFIYLAGLQLLLSSWKRSILPGVCGILAGFIYRLNIFHIRKAKFPEFIASFFSRLSWPSVGSPPAAPSRGNLPSFAGRPRNYPSVPSATEPSEDSIATLVSMGFDRNDARQALVQARNDVNVATNILLEAQSH
ncbi:hypothetical protein TIFTF001_026817 [Ficus carica]|uniref:UBA domain-containing protein n=1 Tax=Ficus carica TaxID=3494 RepID=A0AA88DLV7_FICCA|nr:hypothetical protein TIFTF001_026817 [Ficus carica]